MNDEEKAKDAEERLGGLRVIVFHSSYGCETGCCGHIIELRESATEKVLKHEFRFDHPSHSENMRQYAEALVRDEFGEKHVADLDWEHCIISTD